jgi:hypothetical protein
MLDRGLEVRDRIGKTVLAQRGAAAGLVLVARRKVRVGGVERGGAARRFRGERCCPPGDRGFSRRGVLRCRVLPGGVTGADGSSTGGSAFGGWGAAAAVSLALARTAASAASR